MKNKFILIFLVLLSFPIILSAESKKESVEICNNGVNSGNYLYSKAEETEVGEGYESYQITVYNFATKDGDSAYCIQPGKKAAGVNKCHSFNLIKDFINEDCKNSKDGFECGLAAILGYVNNQKNEELGYEYVDVLTALRLWTASESPEAKSGDGLWIDGGATKKTFIYTTTVSEIKSNNDYSGLAYKNGTNIVDSYDVGLLHINTNEPAAENQVERAFGLFKMALDGIEVFVANIKTEKDEYTFDESGKTTIRLITNFDASTENVEVTSEDVTVDSVDEVGECGEKNYCYDVRVSISLEDLKTCDEKNVTLNIKYKDSRDVLSHVKKYETNRMDFQTFIVYDEDAKEGEKELEVKILCGENEEPSGDKCPYTGIKYDGATECSGYEDTEEYKITDPELCTVMNMDKEKYKLDDIKYEYNGKLNTVCSVYCREKILFKFMGKKDAIAGRTFKYNVQGNTLKGDNKYITAVIATRECASKNIEYDTWKKHYEEVNAKLLEAWNNFKLWEARSNHEIEHKETKTCTKCGCGTCEQDYGEIQQTGTIENPKYEWVSNIQIVNDACREASTSKWVWYSWSNANYQKTNSDTNTNIINVDGKDGSNSFDNSCYENCPSTTFANCSYTAGESAKEKMNTYKTDYEKYNKLKDEMIKAIEDCSYLNEDGVISKILEYTFKSNPDVEYDDYYSDVVEVKEEQAEANKEVTTKYCNGDNCSYKSICPECDADASAGITQGLEKEKLIYWNCSGSETNAKCENKTVEVPKSKAAYITTEAESAYYQSINFYTELYTGKVNTLGGENYIPIKDESGQTNYLYPLELDKENGEYNITETFENINENFRKNLGLTLINDVEYKCTINICNETVLYEGRCTDPVKPSDEEEDPTYCNSSTTCCPGDIYPYNPNCPRDSNKTTLGFIFRPIDMKTVFPNIRAKGRNWANSLSVIKAIETLSTNFWSTVTPQYSVTINPTQIKNIKGYNLKQNSVGGYLDYSISCTNETGATDPSNCVSKFLTDYLPGNSVRYTKVSNIKSLIDKFGNHYTWREE